MVKAKSILLINSFLSADIAADLLAKFDKEFATSLYKQFLHEKINSNKLQTDNSEQAAPDFEFNDLNDKSLSLHSLKGKVVFIDVWASWCKPCLANVPLVKAMEKQLAAKNIVFIYLNKDANKRTWQQTVMRLNLGGINLWAGLKSPFDKNYLIDGLPTYIIIDKNGKLVEKTSETPSAATINKLETLAN